MVPPQHVAQIAEIAARIEPLLDEAAFVGFDSNGSEIEHAAMTLRRIWPEDDPLLDARHLSAEVAQPASLELGSNGEAAGADIDGQPGHRLPSPFASVCLDDLVQKGCGSHLASPWSRSRAPTGEFEPFKIDGHGSTPGALECRYGDG